MNTLIDTLRYFIIITLELTTLFIGISALVALILMYLPQDKIEVWMAGKGAIGNIFGAIIGSVTPFCACSTIPLTLGFLKAGVPFGAVMSFVISSPLLNPVIIGMMIVLLNLQSAFLYFIIVFLAAVIFGVILEKIGGSKLVKRVRLKREVYQDDLIPESFKSKLKFSLIKAGEDFKGVLKYLLIGVSLGAIIYGYLPQDLVLKYAGTGNPFAIPIAAIIGIPLYIRAETAIPIGISLLQKGMNIGAVIALIIGGAGMAIPEMSMLASIFKKRLVVVIVLVIFLTAVAGGYIFMQFNN